ncbi:nucleoside monophosphate kinase, partial [Streptococcus pluranimalium]
MMGLPGAGKGTQAAKIVDTYGVSHISTGDICRAAMKNANAMGHLAQSFIDKVDFIPGELTNDIFKKRLPASGIQANGFLLNGYPSTLDQTHSLVK